MFKMLLTPLFMLGRAAFKVAVAMASEKVIIETILAFASDYVAKTPNKVDDVFIKNLKEVLKV